MSDSTGSPQLCGCGCGEPAPIATRTRRAIGHVKGQPLKYIHGHQGRGMGAERRARVAEELSALDITGLCGCGCGEPAPIATATNRTRGHIKGQPQKYIKGHSATRKTRKLCAADDCDGETTAEYCRKHAERMRLYGNLVGKRPKGDDAYRFWFRVDKSGDCWIWTAARGAGKFDYGYFWTSEKKLTKAHRFSYELANGSIPEGMVVCHRCDNPPCVRPDHLFLGTQADNVHDMDSKGRGRRPGKRDHCPKGHPYDESNSVRRKDGAQSCSLCRKEWRRTTRDRQREAAMLVSCPRCWSAAGRPCTGRFGVMVSAHQERIKAARPEAQPDA